MKPYIITFSLIVIVAALMACSGSGYTSSYHSSYSYPVNYGYSCVHSKKVKISTKYHPVYGLQTKKTVKHQTTCY
jgi:hypothetical protein